MIPAAGYLRMSSDQQATSIADQRKAVIEYAAANGYAIVKWYIDEGISGWRNDRAQFQKLIADAPRGTFKTILVWDQDRFSRFEPMEANFYWFQLKQAGVSLVTVTQGRIDWDTLAGWLTASISQHGKAEYCRSLGQNVARGQRTRKLAGQWIGSPPIGYDLGSDGFLTPGEPAAVALVRRIFKLRVAGHGTKYIASVLNRDGIKSPRGVLWSSQAVRHILQRDAYRGIVVIGKWARGKYARIVDGRQTVKNTHPAIIDQETWDAAQAMRQKRTKKRHNGDGEGAPLAGLLYCGDCGKQLYSQRFLTYGTAHYLCGTYHASGGCHCNRVDQAATLQMVLKRVREALGLSDMIELRSLLAKKLAAKPTQAVDRQAIERQLRAVETKIATATERLVTVAPSLVPTVEAKLLELQAERDRLKASLAVRPKASRRFTVSQAIKPLEALDRILRKGTPSQQRAALSGLIARIDIRFEAWKETSDGRKYRRPCGGVITLLTNGEQPSERTSLIGKRVIPLSRKELASCVRQRPWNYGSGTA